MTQGTVTRAPAHFACVGIGVGPANLSLASLLHGCQDLPSRFLERKPDFGWHDGQQIAGTTLQVSMLKDLVTLSDPTNDFSFLNYLHDQGRVYHFINAQFDAVPRREFRDYLRWAAHRNPNLEFGREVDRVEFDGVFTVHSGDLTVTAENIALGVGVVPWLPEFVRPHAGPEHFHISEFTQRATELAGRRVAVIGGGQSGAEAFLDLITRPDGQRPRQVSWISRRENFFPIDDSPFTNDYYMPSHSDYFYGLERALRDAFNQHHILTSDGISMDTLRAIYQAVYTRRFIDREPEPMGLHPGREVTGMTRGAHGWDLAAVSRHRPGATEHIQVDAVVWATGFRPAPTDFLAPIAGRLEREGEEYRVDEDFAVLWDGPADRCIFSLNATRGQRGLADPNLSLIAWRAQRILDRMRGVRGKEQLASFIEWSDKQAGPAVSEALSS